MPWRFETQQIHAGAEPDPVTGSRVTPIHQTASFVFRSTEHAEHLFSFEEPGNFYSRITNPTTAVVEERIAALEGGSGALLFASGQAATTAAILTIAGAGDHVVSSASVYGGTFTLLQYTLASLGIEATFVEDQDDAEAWRRAIRPNTKLLFAETIGNPRVNVLNTPLVAQVAHERGLPLIVDNTIATPYLIRPLEQGADIVVHSATKFLGGHGAVIAGVIVDGGRFDWAARSERFPGLTSPDPSYRGVSYTESVGNELAYITKARVSVLRDLGASIAPQSSWQLLQGIETLSLRMERHVENAERVAEWLDERAGVQHVYYPTLSHSPWHFTARELAPNGVGAVVSFELTGGAAAGRRLVESVRLFSHLANIGDVRSLIIHPASTTHGRLTDDELRAAGISPGAVRLSVGLEHIDDILGDLEQALEIACAPQRSLAGG